MNAATLVRRGPLAVMVSVALVTTACGSSSSSKSVGSTATSAATTTAAASAAAGATTTAAGATSSAPSAGATTTAAGLTAISTAPTTVKATGGGKFCKDMASAANYLNAAPTASTPDAMKKQVATVIAVLKGLAAEAPSSIQSDVKVVVGTVNDLYTALQKANYDYTKVDPKLAGETDSAAFKASEAKVEAYVKNTCGLDISGS